MQGSKVGCLAAGQRSWNPWPRGAAGKRGRELTRALGEARLELWLLCRDGGGLPPIRGRPLLEDCTDRQTGQITPVSQRAPRA